MTPEERTIRLVLARSHKLEQALRESAAELRDQASYICAAEADGIAEGIKIQRETLELVLGDEPPTRSLTLADTTALQVEAARVGRGG